MLYDISPPDFADHVRHANSWNDLGIRCGLEPDVFGKCNNNKLSMIQEKVENMRLNTEHFHGQKQIKDDDFKIIVKESTCLTQVLRKCNLSHEKEKVLERIESLCIDIAHFKTRKNSKPYNCRNKVDEIDEETFKTLVKNNTTWKYLSIACGYAADGGGVRIFLDRRIEKLGLNTYHFDDVTPTDKVLWWTVIIHQKMISRKDFYAILIGFTSVPHARMNTSQSVMVHVE
jgi:hypothetical protein